MTALHTRTFRENKLRAAPRAPPTLAHSDHPVACHTARGLRALLRQHLRRGERCATQQHGPRCAPSCAVAAHTRRLRDRILRRRILRFSASPVSLRLQTPRKSSRPITHQRDRSPNVSQRDHQQRSTSAHVPVPGCCIRGITHEPTLVAVPKCCILVHDHPSIGSGLRVPDTAVSVRLSAQLKTGCASILVSF